jgi:hypothetical protein
VPCPKASSREAVVYILGASHVSRASCDCVRELIEAVRPDVVLVELCKDRLGLLVDPVRPVIPQRSLRAKRSKREQATSNNRLCFAVEVTPGPQCGRACELRCAACQGVARPVLCSRNKPKDYVPSSWSSARALTLRSGTFARFLV